MHGALLASFVCLTSCAPAATPRATAEGMLSAARTDAAIVRAELLKVERENRAADDLARSTCLHAVESADARLARAYEAGLERRTTTSLEGGFSDLHVVVLPLPAEIAGAIDARRTLLERVPARPGDEEERGRWAFEIAHQYALYGHFAEATPFYRRVWQSRCGKDHNGYLAWEQLMFMANAMGDAEQARALAQSEIARSCMLDDQRTPPYTAPMPLR